MQTVNKYNHFASMSLERFFVILCCLICK